MLGRLFGTKNGIKEATKIIDDAFYTKEERIQDKVELLKAYTPFRNTQRILAFGFSFFFLAFVLVYVGLELMGLGDKATIILEAIKAFNFGSIVEYILMFYFGGGALNSLADVMKKGK